MRSHNEAFKATLDRHILNNAARGSPLLCKGSLRLSWAALGHFECSLQSVLGSLGLRIELSCFLLQAFLPSLGALLVFSCLGSPGAFLGFLQAFMGISWCCLDSRGATLEFLGSS